MIVTTINWTQANTVDNLPRAESKSGKTTHNNYLRNSFGVHGAHRRRRQDQNLLD